MPGRLTGNRALFDVPEDLTYFSHEGTYLVVNPQIGGRCVLTPQEFGVLRTLTRLDEPLAETPETERALAKLILNWIVYYDRPRPSIQPKEPPLVQVYYAITDGCNLRCPYCYASSEKCLPGELSHQESLDLVTQAAELGAKYMIFTGGEPMLRKDLFEVVEHANRCGMKSNIVTNATMIRKPEQARRFAELFNQVTISVDGGTAETHDRTRGKGSFARTHRALRLLNAEGVVPQINHIVTSENVDELEGFAAFMDGVEVADIRLMYHNNLGRGVDDEYEFGFADHMRIQKLVWTSPALGKLRPDGPRPTPSCTVRANCGMGGNEIYVNSLGDVYPCKLITGREHLAGNVRRESLREIFEGELLFEMRNSTVFGGGYHADCAKCYVKPFCGGGCRATHLSESLDLRRNSRPNCRILRHGVTTHLWLETGVGTAVLASNNDEMTRPRLVSGDAVHPVYEDWKSYTPPAPQAVKVRELLPISPVERKR
jgi:radical SAM protein with 4Fe4S-binding SPASM domain